MPELCLGTAQLGMEYGIHNKAGKLERGAVFDILDVAIKNNIKIWDTASIYGEAEELLGAYLSSHGEIAGEIKVISKQCDDIVQLDRSSVEKKICGELWQSLKRLHRDFLDGYLLHSYRGIDNQVALEILCRLKEEKLVRNIGVSVYEIDEAEKALDKGFIDYLQMPFSVFDQRGMTSGIFQKAKEKGIMVFIRSAFLQGVLMMEECEVPRYISELKPYITKFNRLCNQYHITKRHALLKFVLAQDLVDYMVFGVETKEQLGEIVGEIHTKQLPSRLVEEIRKNFGDISTDLILPIHWKKQ